MPRSIELVFNTIMTSERIFRSARTARGLVPYNLPRPAISLPSQKLAVCTIATSASPPDPFSELSYWPRRGSIARDLQLFILSNGAISTDRESPMVIAACRST